MSLKIIPLCLGHLEVDKSIQISLHHSGEKMKVACIAWLIVGAKCNVIVDSGPASIEWSTKYHRPMTRSSDEYIESGLANYGLHPEDIDIIINTHLHWDHCYGNTELPKAKILVQRDELRYAVAPLPRDARAYETDIKTPPFTNFYNRIEILDGDKDILPGIRVLKTPGHTPGMQSVAVKTIKGEYIIASDTFNLFENFESDPPLPPGIFYDLEKFYASAQRIIKEADYILPGHDPAVFNCKSYPE